MSAKGREVVAPFRFPRGSAPPVTGVRSTLVTASLQGMRAMGWEERYYAALPAELHAEVRGLVAGQWLPVSLALHHYRACDAMGLSQEEIHQIGETVSRRTQDTFVGTILRTAAGAGATPWHLYSNAHRIWSRMIDGADQCVYRLGPKEALVHILECEMLTIPYFRVAVRAYYRAAAVGLTRAIYVNEERAHPQTRSIEMRISWA
ncbi:MAG: hypothetical protein ACXVEF_07315 [Polyangiales bacterium]